MKCYPGEFSDFPMQKHRPKNFCLIYDLEMEDDPQLPWI